LEEQACATVPAGEVQRYGELIALRDVEPLSGAEHAELLRLSDADEERNAKRITALAELAILRGVMLDAVLRDLGLSGAANAGERFAPRLRTAVMAQAAECCEYQARFSLIRSRLSTSSRAAEAGARSSAISPCCVRAVTTTSTCRSRRWIR
jgi:hypothetical protein